MNHFKEEEERRREVFLYEDVKSFEGWFMHEEASPADDLFRHDDHACSPRVIEDSRE